MKDTNDLQNMFNHFAPNDSIISFPKLLGFLRHRIEVYKKEQKSIQEDATYYVLQDPDALKLVETNQRVIDEYEWLLEFIEDNHHLITM